MHQFQLFLDESGDFRETSTEASERQATRNPQTPSQLAGLLVPRGTLTAPIATAILEDLFASVGRQYRGEFHAKDLDPGTVSKLVDRALDHLADRGWQPVRLTNREATVFGDRATTYTNLVAELLLRCFERLRRDGNSPIGIELHCAGVWDEQRNATLDRSDYLPRLQEVLARAAIRSGHGDQQRHWSLAGFVFRSGMRDPELHLCDLLSNASWSDFRKLDGPTRMRLQESLGDFDLTLQLREDLERLDDLMAIGALGQALVHAAECELDTDRVDRVRFEARRRRDRMSRDLAALGAPARDVHLQTILTHLEQVIQWQRDLAPGTQLAEWCRTAIVEPMRRLLPATERDEVDWFEYGVLLRLLMASNHAGDLQGASNHAERMRTLHPGITARWEHIDLFLQGQIHLAVHYTDARSCDIALATARRVADFHGNLAGLLQAAMPDLPADVRSTRRGEALGTAMQAAMVAGIDDPSQFAMARALGDAALAEFASAADRARQAQYRCQLESLAGDFAAAREWLARAVASAADHASIRHAIARTVSESSRGFLLLHWLRLGSRVLQHSSATAEATAFAAAWTAADFAKEPWLIGERSEHPSPSIMRYCGEVAMALGDAAMADRCLRWLRERGHQKLRTNPLLAMPMLALWTAQAAQAAEQDERRLKNLMQDRAESQGLLSALSTACEALQRWPVWHAHMKAWLRAAQQTQELRSRLEGCDSLRKIVSRTHF